MRLIFIVMFGIFFFVLVKMIIGLRVVFVLFGLWIIFMFNRLDVIFVNE